MWHWPGKHFINDRLCFLEIFPHVGIRPRLPQLRQLQCNSFILHKRQAADASCRDRNEGRAKGRVVHGVSDLQAFVVVYMRPA